MASHRISRYPVPKLKDLPPNVRSRIEKVQEKAGFIPNVFITLAHRPAEFRAFFYYHDALLLKGGGLTKAEREMIIVATSAANLCHYCVIAHGAIAALFALSNRMANLINMRPNDEFYLLGRVPKA